MQTHDAATNPLTALLQGLPPAHARLTDYLIAQASINGAADACVEDTRRITYRELAVEVARHAALLRALGVVRGDRVAALVPPSIDFFVCFLAATSLGAVWLGLNPKHTRAELQYVVGDAQPKVLWARSRIAERDYLDDLRTLATSDIHLALFDSRPDAADLASVDAVLAVTGAISETSVPTLEQGDHPALLVYTSGTTGAPKGALLSHRSLIRAALVRSQVWRVQPMRSLNNVPVSHVGSVGDIACTTLVAGGCQIFLEKFDAADTLKLLAAERVTFWYQAPTMFQLCLDHPHARGTDWSHLQAVVWSGGRASNELIARLAKIAPYLAVDYSMTESVGAITLAPLTPSSTATTLVDSVGWPDPARSIRVADPERSTPVPANTPGEVQISDAWMFSGYRNALQSGQTRDGWFRTGDLAVRQADGSFQITGRLKEMFKSGGYNIYPKEVELAIERHANVSTAAVVPVADELYGEVGVAFVVLKDAALDASDLVDHCRALLARYKIPKHFVISAQLPLLPVGKMDKSTLRARAQELRNTGALS